MAAKQEEGEEASTRLCGHCQQHIQEQKFELHEIGCRRYFTTCEVCNESVPKTELDQHNEEEHVPVPCDLCGEMLLKEQIEPHKDTTCPDYMIICKYCQLEIRREDHEDHIEGCGSRTDLCELCDQRVILRDMYEHQQNKCPHMKADETLDITQLQEFQDPRQDLFSALLSRSALGGGGFGFGLPSHPLGFNVPSHPLGFNVPSPHRRQHQQQPGFAHPFVPQPARINHDQSYPREPDPPPPPREQSYPREPDPLPSRDPHEGESMRVDPQWVDSVVDVCGEERLDSVLAQNIAAEDLKRQNPPSRSPSLSPHHVPLQAALETVQAHSGFARGAGMGRGQYSPQSEVHMKDAELARELYEGDVAYAQRYDVPFGGQGEASDSLLAKEIHDRETAYCESQARDHELARRMQEEEERRVEYSRRALEEDTAEREHELAKRAQERERLAQFGGGGGIQDGGGAYQRELPQEEERRVREVREARERELAYNELQKKDHALAKQMQEEEQLGLRGYYGGLGRAPVFRDTEFGYHNTGSGGDTVFRDTERDSVLGRLQERTDVSDRAVLDNEEPRPKTPPLQVEDAGKIPCEFCNKLYSFEMISDHQRSCYPAPTSATVVYVRPTHDSFIPPSIERRKDPMRQDPMRQDPVRQDPVRQDQVRQDQVRQDPVRQDPMRMRDPSAGVVYPAYIPSRQRGENPPPPSTTEYSPSTDCKWQEEPSPYMEKRQDYTPTTQWREKAQPYTKRDYPSSTPPRDEIVAPLPTERREWDRPRREEMVPLRPQDPVYVDTNSDEDISITASSHEMGDEKCPCEECGELFSLRELMRHESICRFRKNAKTSAVIQNGGGRINPQPSVGGERVNPQALRVNPQAFVGGGRVNPQPFVGGERSRPTAATTKSAVYRGKTKLAIKFPDHNGETKMDATTTNQQQQRGVLPAATNIGRGRQHYTHREGGFNGSPGHNGSGDPPLTVKGHKIQAGRPALQVDRRKPPVS